jgi:hypothetical protein
VGAKGAPRGGCRPFGSDLFTALALTEKDLDYLRREAAAGRREDFDRYLAAVPDMAPPEEDRID